MTPHELAAEVETLKRQVSLLLDVCLMIEDIRERNLDGFELEAYVWHSGLIRKARDAVKEVTAH